MFRFKLFTVEDDYSSQKVCTDSTLLGAWVPLPEQGKILDVGTGCGIISLICAQRTNCFITGIDIHRPSVIQARENFQKSPWKERLSAAEIAFQHYSPGRKFEVIVSNPPYFRNSLKSPDINRNIARHDLSLAYEDLFYHAMRLLEDSGWLGICFPFPQLEVVTSLAMNNGLFPNTMVKVKSCPKEEPYLVMATFGFQPNEITPGELTIYDENGNYSEPYKQLTKAFYLNF